MKFAEYLHNEIERQSQSALETYEILKEEAN